MRFMTISFLVVVLILLEEMPARTDLMGRVKKGFYTDLELTFTIMYSLGDRKSVV